MTEPEPARSDAQALPAPAADSGAEEPTVAGLVPPRVIERVTPVYPGRARNRRQGAEIVLRVLVAETGGIARVQVEQGNPDEEFEAAAIDAVLRWRYEPATENGVPVRAWTIERIVFRP